MVSPKTYVDYDLDVNAMGERIDPALLPKKASDAPTTEAPDCRLRMGQIVSSSGDGYTPTIC